MHAGICLKYTVKIVVDVMTKSNLCSEEVPDSEWGFFMIVI